MGFYSGWSSRRGLYGGYGVRLSGGASRRPRGGGGSAGSPARGDELPEWVELSYFATVAVVFVGGLVASAVWLWFETSTVNEDGTFVGLVARLTIIVVMLIPAIVACGIGGIVAGFGAVLIVGTVRGGIAVRRWVRERRLAKAAAL